MDPMTWLTQIRGLDADMLHAMRVRTASHEQLGPVAAFPYIRGGKPYAAKFRRPKPKDWRSTQGVSRGFFNEDVLDQLPALPIVIAEGEMDCLSCIQSGFERSVSLPDGWTEDGGKRDILIQNEARLRNSPYVIVAADADAAGSSLPREVMNILSGHDVREATWPTDCKDPNDILVTHGADMLGQMLTGARVLDPPGGFITGFSDFPPMSERRVLRTGMQPFDQVVALQLSAISVWTGVPGSGKSTFLVWAAEKVSTNENIRVGHFAFETHPHDLRDQLSLIRTGTEYSSLDDKSRAALDVGLDRRYRVVHRIFDGDASHRMEWLTDTIRQLAVRDGCKLIVVDPWNELEHLPDQGESMTQYINWALQRLRQVAEELEIHIALVAHPKKYSEQHKAPTGYDVADSAAFFNKPSLGASVHQREGEGGEEYVELNVWKVRNVRLFGFGKGRVYVEFDPSRASYTRRDSG